ncbi:hypothetical protein C488_01719 [Natrinema pellirubrum DSM 15624]|uniref:DUF7344 domain-containing protein n=1 Tax=Natrinema pellirubrum (strain DSM 15624 / CIP 106293 / JCM 10476 / NCIMB 786 / 157) TaxID=797303 RepID=L0JHY9_NATP1|nr:hypothetical protein [Natrinema pellirubrum]AGB31150.1 hypothetical protein Natpe_1245 [Natrinema pellirubrum DSM 15624]ELY81486.1 hypothetical protein C488_01719 [Natrinema pellirubrum DSM 15624]
MSGDSIAFDSVLDLCQHQHRRIVLAILAAEQRSLTLNDLTKTVLKYNHHTPLTEVSEDRLAEIRLSLCHVHLPKLASEGLITHDPDRQLVEPTEQFEQVQPTLTTILDADPTLEAPIEL